MAFPIGWQRVCPLTISKSLVAANSLTSFPVLITAACLPTEMVTLAGANAAQSDGGDIRFSSDPSGLVQLPCEVVSWVQNATPASATAEIWINTTVSGVTDTLVYVWYKAAAAQTQPAIGAAFGAQAVWSPDYKFVWHGGDGTTLGLTDSTSNANTLTNTGAVTAAAGKIGGGGSFGGANYLSKTSPTGLPTSGAITVEGWMKRTNATGNMYAILGSLYAGSAAALISVANVATTMNPYAWIGSAVRAATGALTLSTWAHVAHVYTDPTYSCYINGARDTTGTFAQVFGATGLFIGALDGPSGFWIGQVDEARISSTVRSPGWMATQYVNHTSPATFTVAGTAYSPGAYAEPSGFYSRQFR